MRAEINGVGLHYRVEGREGAPWLVFGNSLATDLGMWDAEAAYYADRYRILRYDTRGHGGSEASPAPCICEANFGSSAASACSICSSIFCSWSERGTDPPVVGPGRRSGRPRLAPEVSG